MRNPFDLIPVSPYDPSLPPGAAALQEARERMARLALLLSDWPKGPSNVVSGQQVSPEPMTPQAPQLPAPGNVPRVPRFGGPTPPPTPAIEAAHHLVGQNSLDSLAARLPYPMATLPPPAEPRWQAYSPDWGNQPDPTGYRPANSLLSAYPDSGPLDVDRAALPTQPAPAPLGGGAPGHPDAGEHGIPATPIVDQQETSYEFASILLGAFHDYGGRVFPPREKRQRQLPLAGFPNNAVATPNPDGSYSVTDGMVVAIRSDRTAVAITVKPNSGESILVRPDGTFAIQRSH